MFYHVPKCGGNYIRTVIKEISNNVRDVQGYHSTPLDRPRRRHKFENSFCVVRHPLEWYKSFFRYRIQTKWRLHKRYGPHPVDIHCFASTFEEFIQKVLVYHPFGMVTDLYLNYIPFCKFVLKQENLTNQLEDLLKRWGYDFPNIKKRIHVTPKNIDTSLSEATTKKIINAEYKIIRHLNY